MSTPMDKITSEPEWIVIKPKPKDKMSNPKKDTIKYKQKYLFNMKNLQGDKIHFLPKPIKTTIDNLFDRGLPIRELIDEIKYINYNAPVRPSAIVYILNQAASTDKLDYIEYILANIEDRTKIVNVKCGTMAYTPIIKASYRGSLKALKMLLCAGADLTSQNKEGETVLQALEQGLIDEIARNPQLEIFIQDRYAECKSFITNFRPPVNKNIIFKSYKKKETSSVETSVEKSSVETSSVFASVEKSSVETSSVEDMSILSFISEFSSNENKFKEFISSKDNVTDILIEIFTFIFESDMNDEYQDIIKIIKNIATDDIFKENIISCFQDETIHELVRLDAPYAKEEMNNICNILQIEVIK